MYFSLKGVISTVCYCTHLIISWSTTTKSLWLPMYGRQPLVACSTVPTADENAVTVCSDSNPQPADPLVYISHKLSTLILIYST